MTSRHAPYAARLLLVVFVGGAGGSQALDAVLYHGRPGAHRVQIHLDAAGGCGVHLEQCVLTRSGAQARQLPAVAPAPAWLAATVVGPTARGGSRFGSIELHTLSHPRAPPVV
ncbi:MAG TPA: hypothetical protein VGQ25_11870 [Gemmatimonadales bacterium]|nr:hypothetical protein [Gemmatimonadales bacterium]